MKIGIATISDGTNYGNRLQNYAVEQVAKRYADDVTTIDVGDRIQVPFVESLKIRYRSMQKSGKWYMRLRRLNFDRFNKRNIHFTPYTYRDMDFSDYDYVLCGSGQIWNFRFRIIRENEDYYFARFVPPEKRVAFSASVGTNVISDGFEDTFEDGVLNIKAVSVREESATNLIKQTANKDAICTIDPTLMLDEEDWLKIEKKPKGVQKDNFILTYFMGLKNEDTQNYVKKLSKELNCRVINLHSEFEKGIKKDERESFTYSPSEFVWLVKNCKVMLTDSFHGCVFSILMDKPFQCFARQEKSGIDMSCRLDTLFAKLEIGDWCRGNIQKNAKEVLFKDYSNVSKNLQRERKIASDYLKSALTKNTIRRKMMNVTKDTCTGCEACKSVCPKKCITMEKDKEGFYYPFIDENLCINCGLCEKVCIANKDYNNKSVKEKEVYSAISKDNSSRARSSSGGVFTLLSRAVFEDDGVVFGAAFRGDWTVHHTYATNETELKKLQRSKYVGSHIDNTFVKAKEFLDAGKKVMFTGTLCQINGLKSFLQKDYENLFCVDVVCHGVPSESVWLWYLNEVTGGERITFISQRYKKPSWANYSTLIKHESKGLERGSDLTIADFWGVKKVSPDMFDNKGTSVILVNSDKGKTLMNSIKDDMTFKEENINDVIKYNPSIMAPVSYQEVREKVLNDICSLKKKDLNFIAEKYKLFS